MKTTVYTFSRPFLFVYLSIGLVWLRSFYEKLVSGTFADTLGVVLTKFASKNPYPFYKTYLEKVVIPNAKVYGYVTMWGEFLTALALIGEVAYFLIKPEKNTFVAIILLFGWRYIVKW